MSYDVDFQTDLRRTTMDEKPRAIRPGTVEKIVKSPFSGEAEKAQISVEGRIICIGKYAFTTL
jgi:hypothetical protein